MRYEIDTNGCWNWLGYVNTRGYGVVSVHGTVDKAHRVIYRLLVGQIPGGFHVHHRCGNKRCINPEHLEALQGRAHHQRHMAPNETCKRGHPFDEANTYVKKDGYRNCRACRKEYERRRAGRRPPRVR